MRGLVRDLPRGSWAASSSFWNWGLAKKAPSRAGRWLISAGLFSVAILLNAGEMSSTNASGGSRWLSVPMNLPAEAQQLEVPTNVPPDLRRGWQLAHAYCQVCHLFPEPDLLDQKTWASGALRKMAPFVGAARVNLEGRPDGERLKEAGVYPSSPLISEHDWLAIGEYYLRTAPEKPIPPVRPSPIRVGTSQFRTHRWKNAETGSGAAITLVQIDPVGHRVFTGDAFDRTLDLWNCAGRCLQRIPLHNIPVSLTSRPAGLYVTLIGHLFPTDEWDGALVELPASGSALMAHPILEHLPRATHAAFADLNGDGREDFALAAFGNLLGNFSWYENLGDDRYEPHLLLDQPGAVQSVIADADRDGRPDILVLTAQAKEGVHLFLNLGAGRFRDIPLLEFHPLFGVTHFEWVDFNGDGWPDLLLTNGDNGEYPSPFKNYHGIRIFLNDGHLHFSPSWVYPLNGAFKAVASDFDGDGDLDIAAISYFPNYKDSPEESFVYLENRGGFDFSAQSIPEATEGRWLTMDAGDVDGDGDADVVLGSMTRGPMSVPIPSAVQEQWRTHGVALLWLENRRFHPQRD